MVNEEGLKSKNLFKAMLSNEEWYVNKTKDGSHAIMEPNYAAVYIIRRTYPFKDGFFKNHPGIIKAMLMDMNTLIDLENIYPAGKFWSVSDDVNAPYFDDKFFKYLDMKHLSFKLSPDGKLLYAFNDKDLVAIIANIIPKKEIACLI